MIYDHIVKINGKYYDAGEDAPIKKDKNIASREGMNDPEMDKNDLHFSDNEIEMEEEPARRGRPRKSDL